MAAESQRLYLRVDGHVQGVGFRFTTVSIASRFAVTGYVMNLPDGSVEIVAEGEPGELNLFLSAMKQSGIYRHVRTEQSNWSRATGAFGGFEVRYA